MLTYAECFHTHFSAARASGAATTAHRHFHCEIASKNAKWMHSQCDTKATALMLACWNYFKKPLNNEHKTAAPQNKDPSSSLGVNRCERCGVWFKMKHGKTTCDANRPKELEGYVLKCLRGLGKLWSPVLPQTQLWLWLTFQKMSL